MRRLISLFVLECFLVTGSLPVSAFATPSDHLRPRSALTERERLRPIQKALDGGSSSLKKSLLTWLKPAKPYIVPATVLGLNALGVADTLFPEWFQFLPDSLGTYGPFLCMSCTAMRIAEENEYVRRVIYEAPRRTQAGKKLASILEELGRKVRERTDSSPKIQSVVDEEEVEHGASHAVQDSIENAFKQGNFTEEAFREFFRKQLVTELMEDIFQRGGDSQKAVEDLLEGLTLDDGRSIEKAVLDWQREFGILAGLAKLPKDEKKELHRDEERPGEPPKETTRDGGAKDGGNGKSFEEYLKQFSMTKEERDFLTSVTRDMAVEAELARPIVGRSAEISRIMGRLSTPSKTKNSAILVGPRGVGKTVLAEQVALKLYRGEVEGWLQGRRMVEVNVEELGTDMIKLAEQMNKLIKIVEKTNGQLILFIDEIHKLMVGPAGTVDFRIANLLKPVLEKGRVTVLGSTTDPEYKAYIEQDKAFEDRFLKIAIREPSLPEATQILLGTRAYEERKFGMAIDRSAIEMAVKGSERHLPEKSLPRKAIDTLEGTLSRVNARTNSLRVVEEDIVNRLLAAVNDTISLRKQGETDRSGQAVEAHNRTVWALQAYEEVQERKRTLRREVRITDVDVAQYLSEQTGIPVEKLGEEDAQKYLKMEEALHQRVIAQDEAIRAISQVIRRNMAGLRAPNRPIGVFLLPGPTGVGKTELAKALAEFLFNEEAAMIRFDMTEYQQEHEASKLIGAPPGYVGYHQGGQLTEAVRKRPYSVLLLDEIEKAHPRILETFMQVFDDGRLTDGQGNLVDFTNTVIIMTSNIGTHEIQDELAALGEELKKQTDEGKAQEIIDRMNALIAQSVAKEVRRRYKPEIINRINKIVLLQVLTPGNMKEIARILLNRELAPLKEKKYDLAIDDRVYEVLANRGYEVLNGARPLRRLIEEEINTPLSNYLLEEMAQGRAAQGGTIRIYAGSNGDIQFAFEAREATAERLTPSEKITPVFGNLTALTERIVDSPETELSREALDKALQTERASLPTAFSGQFGVFWARTPIAFQPQEKRNSNHSDPHRKDSAIAAVETELVRAFPSASVILPAWLKETVRLAKAHNPGSRIELSWAVGQEVLTVQIEREGRLTEAEEAVLKTNLVADVKSAEQAREVASTLAGQKTPGLRRPLLELKGLIVRRPGATFGVAETESAVRYWLKLPESSGAIPLPQEPATGVAYLDEALRFAFESPDELVRFAAISGIHDYLAVQTRGINFSNLRAILEAAYQDDDKSEKRKRYRAVIGTILALLDKPRGENAKDGGALFSLFRARPEPVEGSPLPHTRIPESFLQAAEDRLKATHPHLYAIYERDLPDRYFARSEYMPSLSGLTQLQMEDKLKTLFILDETVQSLPEKTKELLIYLNLLELTSKLALNEKEPLASDINLDLASLLTLAEGYDRLAPEEKNLLQEKDNVLFGFLKAPQDRRTALELLSRIPGVKKEAYEEAKVGAYLEKLKALKGTPAPRPVPQPERSAGAPTTEEFVRFIEGGEWQPFWIKDKSLVVQFLDPSDRRLQGKPINRGRLTVGNTTREEIYVSAELENPQGYVRVLELLLRMDWPLDEPSIQSKLASWGQQAYAALPTWGDLNAFLRGLRGWDDADEVNDIFFVAPERLDTGKRATVSKYHNPSGVDIYSINVDTELQLLPDGPIQVLRLLIESNEITKLGNRRAAKSKLAEWEARAVSAQAQPVTAGLPTWGELRAFLRGLRHPSFPFSITGEPHIPFRLRIVDQNDSRLEGKRIRTDVDGRKGLARLAYIFVSSEVVDPLEVLQHLTELDIYYGESQSLKGILVTKLAEWEGRVAETQTAVQDPVMSPKAEMEWVQEQVKSMYFTASDYSFLFLRGGRYYPFKLSEKREQVMYAGQPIDRTRYTIEVHSEATAEQLLEFLLKSWAFVGAFAQHPEVRKALTKRLQAWQTQKGKESKDGGTVSSRLGARLEAVEGNPLLKIQIPGTFLAQAEARLQKTHPHLYEIYSKKVTNRYFASYMSSAAGITRIGDQTILLLEERYQNLPKGVSNDARDLFLYLHLLHESAELALRETETLTPNINTELAAFLTGAQGYYRLTDQERGQLKQAAKLLDELEPDLQDRFGPVLTFLDQYSQDTLPTIQNRETIVDFLTRAPGMNREDYDEAKVGAYLEKLKALKGTPAPRPVPAPTPPTATPEQYAGMPTWEEAMEFLKTLDAPESVFVDVVAQTNTQLRGKEAHAEIITGGFLAIFISKDLREDALGFLNAARLLIDSSTISSMARRQLQSKLAEWEARTGEKEEKSQDGGSRAVEFTQALDEFTEVLGEWKRESQGWDRQTAETHFETWTQWVEVQKKRFIGWGRGDVIPESPEAEALEPSMERFLDLTTEVAVFFTPYRFEVYLPLGLAHIQAGNFYHFLLGQTGRAAEHYNLATVDQRAEYFEKPLFVPIEKAWRKLTKPRAKTSRDGGVRRSLQAAPLHRSILPTSAILSTFP